MKRMAIIKKSPDNQLSQYEVNSKNTTKGRSLALESTEVGVIIGVFQRCLIL